MVKNLIRMLYLIERLKNPKDLFQLSKLMHDYMAFGNILWGYMARNGKITTLQIITHDNDEALHWRPLL
jgi:hypothetical protein